MYTRCRCPRGSLAPRYSVFPTSHPVAWIMRRNTLMYHLDARRSVLNWRYERYEYHNLCAFVYIHADFPRRYINNALFDIDSLNVLLYLCILGYAFITTESLGNDVHCAGDAEDTWRRSI